MFNNEVLEVVIGLVFVYLLYSLLGTLLQEIIATNINLRGWILENGIRRMLDDGSGKKNVSDNFYAHPLVRYLGGSGWLVKNKKAAYLTKETFSKVVIDLLKGEVLTGDAVKDKIADSLSSGQMKGVTGDAAIAPETLRYFKSLWSDSKGDVQQFKVQLEFWFEEMMNRVTGWYKKRTQMILFFVGLAIAISFNVDTLKIVDKLQKDPELRKQVVAQADAFVKAHPNLEDELKQQKQKVDSTLSSDGRDSVIGALDRKYAETKALRDTLVSRAERIVSTDIAKTQNILGMGWPKNGRNWSGWPSILGWILTAFAISLGAPFWFDTLNKVMKLRSSVPAKNGGEQNTTVPMRRTTQLEPSKN